MKESAEKLQLGRISHPIPLHKLLSSGGELVTAPWNLSIFHLHTPPAVTIQLPHKAPPGNGIAKHGQLFGRVPWDQPRTNQILTRMPPPQRRCGRWGFCLDFFGCSKWRCGRWKLPNPHQMKILRWFDSAQLPKILWVMKICRFLSSRDTPPKTT